MTTQHITTSIRSAGYTGKISGVQFDARGAYARVGNVEVRVTLKTVRAVGVYGC